MSDTKLRILVVDDSRDYAMSLNSALARYATVQVVGWAADGADAIRQAASARPDLILMDIAMPGMNGLEATRRIKQGDGAPAVVMLTMYDLEEYRRAAREAGADGFIVKSELGADLLATIEAECPSAFMPSGEAG